MKRYTFLYFFPLFFFAFTSIVHAATVTITGGKSQIQSSDEYEVQVSLSINAASGSAYFLRGVFYKPGTTNYCGYTWNGNNWFNGPYTTNNGWTNLFPIAIGGNNSWSGELKAKIDVVDGGCQNTGAYDFRIERYTPAGNGMFDDQVEQAVQVSVPTPTFTPTPTPSFTPTPNPSTPTPTPTPTFTSNAVNINSAPTALSSQISTTLKISPTSVHIQNIASSLPTKQDQSPSGVLGLAIQPTDDPLQANEAKKLESRKINNQRAAIFFLLGGVILLIICGIVIVYMKKRELKQKDERWE